MSRTRTRKRHAAQSAPTPAFPAPLRLIAPAPAQPRQLNDEHAVAAARAALYAGCLSIPAPINTWTGMGTGQALARLVTGTYLVYTPDPGHLEAQQYCPHGRLHAATVTDPTDITEFTASVTGCQRHNPRALRAQALGTGIHRRRAALPDTQLVDVHVLRATYDQPKEHPQP